MAYPNDMSRLADGIGSSQNSRTDFTGTGSPAGADKAAKRLIRKTYSLSRTPATLANGSDAFTSANGAYGMVMPVAGRLLSAKATFAGAITAANANNFTASVDRVYANGSIAYAMASCNSNTSVNSGTGDISAAVPVSLTLSSTIASTRYPKGAFVGVTLTQNGTGVATKAAAWTIDVEEEDSDDGFK